MTKAYRDGTVEIVDDEACKVVLIASRAVAAYTGLANLPEPPDGRTDLWLVDALSPDEDIDSVLNQVREWALETFRPLGYINPSARRHAFVIAGWHKDRKKSTLRPFYATVSNALMRSGHWLDNALSEFEIRMEGLPRTSPFRLSVAGHPLDSKVRHKLFKALGSPANQEPHTVATLLSQAIRITSATSRTVGSSLLISILPRTTATDTGYGLRLGPDVLFDAEGRALVRPQKGPVSYYVPSDGQAGIEYGPHVVDQGIKGFDFSASTGGPVPTAEQVRKEYETERQRLDVHQEQIKKLKARLNISE